MGKPKRKETAEHAPGQQAAKKPRSGVPDSKGKKNASLDSPPHHEKNKSAASETSKPVNVQSVIAELEQLKLVGSSRFADAISEAGDTISKGMKPGPCLLGNKAEEEAFHRPKPPPKQPPADAPPENEATLGNEKLPDDKEDDIQQTVAGLEATTGNKGQVSGGAKATASNKHQVTSRSKGKASDKGEAGAKSKGKAGDKAEGKAASKGNADTDEALTASDIEMEEGDALVYKPSSRKVTEDVEEELGEYESLQYGHDYIEVPGCTSRIPVWEYFGKDWDKRIEQLYSIQPMACPPNMTIQPRDFQLKAAAQGLYCVNGPFKLFLLGDEMGVGKTLTCVLMMWKLKTQPGMCIVLCPKSLCQNWVDTIQGSWEGKESLRAFMVDDSSVTQTQLIAGGYDVLVCSYEFFAANGQEIYVEDQLEYQLMEYANAQPDGPIRKTPRRPTSALQTEMWNILNMPFKVAFLDEAQKVNKPGKFRHESIKQRLPAQAFTVISGTLPHNKWYDMFGNIDFGQNHPFDTISKFLHTFADFDVTSRPQSPTLPKLRLLQKFLQPMLVARPAKILKMKNCERRIVYFNLTDAEEPYVNLLTADYMRIAGMNSGQAVTDTTNEVGAFGKAVKAQMAAFHPMIAADVKKMEQKKYQDSIRLKTYEDRTRPESLQSMVEEEYGTKREIWLERVRNEPDIIERSGRVSQIMNLYEWSLVEYPEEKMIIFSASLKFLDILAEGLQRKHQVTPVRFDGSVPVSKRRTVEESFQKCDAKIPLLITMNAGGVGLNIAHASIVIISEPQYNANSEAQAIGRAYRQGQDKTVKAFHMVGQNSNIDLLVLGISKRKTSVNATLMAPLIREPDQGPAKIELLSFPGFLPKNYYD